MSKFNWRSFLFWTLIAALLLYMTLPAIVVIMLHDLIVTGAILVEGRQITILDPALLRGGTAAASIAA